MNKHIKKEIGFEEEKADEKIEINPAIFGLESMGGIETKSKYEHEYKPKILKIQRLKSGFFYKRNVLLSEAYFEHCYKSGNSLFTVNVIEGDINSQRRMSFVLSDDEKLQMKDFLADNKVPFEIELVIRLGVPMNGK